VDELRERLFDVTLPPPKQEAAPAPAVPAVPAPKTPVDEAVAAILQHRIELNGHANGAKINGN
jgi:hypothetical protein